MTKQTGYGEILLDEFLQGRWPTLIYISPYRNTLTEGVHIEDYTNVLLMHGDSLQLLHLSNNHESYFNSLRSQSHAFSHLTHLDLQLHNTGSLLDPEQVPIDKCRELTNIKFSKAFSLPSNETTIDQAINLKTINPMRHVKSIESLQKEYKFAINSFNYFIHKFPSLVKLSMIFRVNAQTARVAPLDDFMNTFFAYVTKLQFFDLRFFLLQFMTHITC
jgi:hypothetical protein